MENDRQALKGFRQELFASIQSYFHTSKEGSERLLRDLLISLEGLSRILESNVMEPKGSTYDYALKNLILVANRLKSSQLSKEAKLISQMSEDNMLRQRIEAINHFEHVLALLRTLG